ncbi:MULTISPECIES: hypothetical protein [Natronorubrum]|uniref:Uncharacterized protein n=2 Tax=Natronorubrum TaxID=134813 RepID=L9WGL1_9EURY|nr:MULTISPECIES: hypothetical protein [Natronorubrum]ELY47468.1 hypothetical protein C495_04392 [Natronorubrum sulfidifaciens JCM 14089]ELY51275.1 hypothetical protein C494_02965 [Natronorubrum bangense JCM 10635]
MTVRIGVQAALGLSALAAVALVFLVVDTTLVWLAIGFAGGVLVVGLPRLVGQTAVTPSQSEMTTSRS